jgi:hypothetical protein
MASHVTLDKYRKTACISAFELVIGLPLDRIKIELQQKTNHVTIRPTRHYLKYWYAGNIPSLIQRCVIYMPAIQLTNMVISPDISPYMKSFIIAGVISPYVSFFEGIKTAQQKHVWPEAKNNNMVSIIRHVMYDIKKPELLFASIIPTYFREYCFVTGMVALQPALYNMFSANDKNDKNDKNLKSASLTPLSCLGASIICQTLSQPFDVIKTRMELNPTYSIIDIFAKLKNEQYQHGWRSVYYAGWLPRVIRGMWTFTCMNYLIDFV